MAEPGKSSEELTQPKTPGGSPEPAKKKAIKLSPPFRELAERLLSRAKEWVWAMADHPFDGGNGKRIFSLEEAADFLRLPAAVNDFTCYIEPNALKKWVDKTLGDTELAQAIGQLIKESEYDNCSLIYRLHKEKELIMPLKELLEQRVKQCKELLGEETEA